MAAKQKKGKVDIPQEGKAAIPPEVEVKIAPEITENTPSYYCNFVSVSHSPYYFTLTLVRLPTTLKPEQKEILEKGRRLSVEATLQIIISPRLMPGLIDALSKQKGKYEQRFGEIEKRKEQQ